MSIESVFRPPSNGRKTSNFFPSGDGNRTGNRNELSGSTMAGYMGEDFATTELADFSAYGTIGTDAAYSGPSRRLVGGTDPLKGFGMGLGGDLGDLGNLGGNLGAGASLDLSGGLRTRFGGSSSMDYINISGLNLGPVMGDINTSHSIWSDKRKDGLTFSQFLSQEISPGIKTPSSQSGIENDDWSRGWRKDGRETQEVSNVLTIPRQTFYHAKVNNPEFVPQTPRPKKQVVSNTNTQLIVKLPAKATETPQFPKFHNYFLGEKNDVNNEDYCSTFYKRNSLGFMFIKEPSNSLKVNNSGPRSWVQLKIKFPDTNSAKKLKVDIKQLPFWKPINLNAKDTSRAKKISKDKKKLNILKRFDKYNRTDS